ncbi:MAG: hypothetical protein ACOC2Q_05910 [Spirochaetota bacterium]
MNRRDVILHLIGELSHFILDADPMRVVISLHQESNGFHLAIMDDTVRDDQELEGIRAALNKSKRPELAGYYGSMAGYDLLGEARLDLIGWQIKHADVGSTGQGTKIDLWLGSDNFDPTNFTIPAQDD